MEFETRKVDFLTDLKIQATAQWEEEFQTELYKKLIDKLGPEENEWVQNRRLVREKEINQASEKLLKLKEKEISERDKDKELECISTVSEKQVKQVIAPLKGIDSSMIKTKGVLALVFAYMYDGITKSHPWSIKSTLKNEDKTFEADKKKMIKWIGAIKFRDSDITIHTVVPGIKSSDGITKDDKKENNHLPNNGWDNRYDILIDNLKNLELPSRPKTFYERREPWKNVFKAHGMKNEKKRATLVNAIINFRVEVQEDLDNLKKHDNRMKSIDSWLDKVDKSIKDLSQKLYYF